jgi:tetratricopeptide (TPR) repeat protein
VNHHISGNSAKAERLLRKLLVALPENSPYILKVLDSLASTLGQQGKYDEAIVIYKQQLENYKQKSAIGPILPETLKIMDHLAAALSHQGRYAEAISMFMDCLEKQQFVMGPTHQDTLHTMCNLATNYVMQGLI